MEYTGLVLKYPVNRPLTAMERQLRLEQTVRVDVEPFHQLSVIRLNSTYLELVDKFFPWKGVLTIVALVVMAMFTWHITESIRGSLNMTQAAGRSGALNTGLWLDLILDVLFLLAVIAPMAWVLHKEAFKFTHYPTRLNRKTRTVHFFRMDGSISSLPWDRLFFCLGTLKQNSWEIQAHVLAEDDETVLETFCIFPQIAGSVAERDRLKHHWEFIRRYMEAGPEDAYQRSRVCLPVAEYRESASFGFHRIHREGAGNVITSVLGGLLAIVILPGRYIAMHTSKIPRWPPEVEAVNRVEPGDPFIRDASMNEKWKELPDWLWLFTSAIVWAGIVYGVSSLEPWR